MAVAARAAVAVGLRGVQLRSFGAVASACWQAQARACHPQLPRAGPLQTCHHFATAPPLRAEATEAAGEAAEDTDGEPVFYVKTTGAGSGSKSGAAAVAEGPRQAWVYEMFDEEAPLFRSGIVELSEYVFGAKPRLDIMHRVVVWQRREWWQGTSRTKSRGEVRGGGRKPWRQKGTGRARVSSIRSPLWRGGGVIHGPKPRDNSIKLPKKVHYMALRTALSVKLAQGDLVVVEDFNAPTHKTKEIIRIMEESDLAPSVLFCDGAAVPEKFAKAVRNVPKCAAIDVSELSVYEMLLRHRLVLTRSAVELLEELLGHGVFRGTFDPVNTTADTDADTDTTPAPEQGTA